MNIVIYQSDIPKFNNVLIAKFNNNSNATILVNYRSYLLKKYGFEKQLFTGIHLNLSLKNNVLGYIYNQNKHLFKSYKDFVNQLYFDIFTKYFENTVLWLHFYLGQTPISNNNINLKCNLNEEILSEYNKHDVISVRQSKFGIY